MTDPTDETQPGLAPTPPASTSPDTTPTQQQVEPPAAAADTGSTVPPAPTPVTPGPDASSPRPPSLEVNPDRPSDPAWREPPWFPPRDRDRGPTTFAILVGVILVAVGIWFFLDRTLGFNLPRISWGTIWPVILILLGGLVLLRSAARRR